MQAETVLGEGRTAVLSVPARGQPPPLSRTHPHRGTGPGGPSCAAWPSALLHQVPACLVCPLLVATVASARGLSRAAFPPGGPGATSLLPGARTPRCVPLFQGGIYLCSSRNCGFWVRC